MITITDAAAQQIKNLIEGDDDPTTIIGLRIFVQGGGCSGMSYGFAFETKPTEEDDQVFEHNGMNVIVDAMSFQYITGAQIDFVSKLEGAFFQIKNPNATTTCGCGSSFNAV